jgi:hypothetical protein
MTREGWANRFLRALEAPVSERNQLALVVWMQSEGSPARWNPLATTLRRPGSETMNTHGVQHYPDFETGLEATVATIREDQYARVVRRLERSSHAGWTLKAVAESPWGTSGTLMQRVLTSARRGYYDDYAAVQVAA